MYVATASTTYRQLSSHADTTDAVSSCVSAKMTTRARPTVYGVRAGPTLPSGIGSAVLLRRV